MVPNLNDCLPTIGHHTSEPFPCYGCGGGGGGGGDRHFTVNHVFNIYGLKQSILNNVQSYT